MDRDSAVPSQHAGSARAGHAGNARVGRSSHARAEHTGSTRVGVTAVVLEQGMPAMPRARCTNAGGAGGGYNCNDRGRTDIGSAGAGPSHMPLQPLAASPRTGWNASAGTGLYDEKTHHFSCRDHCCMTARVQGCPFRAFFGSLIPSSLSACLVPRRHWLAYRHTP